MKTIYQIITFFIIAFIVNAKLGEGIHDILPALSRPELERWALAAEKYHNKVLGVRNVPLQDYIQALSDKELITYITKKVGEHPELNSKKFFENLIEKENIRFVLRSGADGGLFSMMWRTPRETLIKWALACEKHHNNGKELMGGIHDMLREWSREDIMKYIEKEVNEHPEIKNLQKLNKLAGIEEPKESLTVAVTNFVNSIFKKPRIIGGLHDYIFRIPREKLVAWALAIEDYVRNVKQVPSFGGIHDYIGTATNEEIGTYILEMAYKYEELNSSDFLNDLAAKKEVAKVKLGGLHDYIWRIPRETLVAWALGVENYVREVTGQQLIGGIHDYIDTATVEVIIKYIDEMVTKYPELDSEEKLNSISSKYYVQKIGGLHDYINTVSRDQLVEWALAIESYVEKQTGQILMGGIHDYIASISIEDLRSYILDNAAKYPELDSRDKLNELSQTKLKARLGGLHDYLVSATREELVDWALACERYMRNITHFKGGIHDYINTATRQQITTYILKAAKKYTELDNIEKLRELVKNKPVEKEDSVQMAGGLHDYIWREPRERLVRWALGVENYIRNVKKVVVLGGIHDYIATATTEEIVSYILEKAEIYKELNSADKLDSIASQFSGRLRNLRA